MSLSDGSSTALAAAPGTSLVKSSVPPGVRIKWFQRKETIWVDIEAPDIDIEELAWDDDGTVQITAKNPQQCVTLQLLHRIHTFKSRWWISGRYVKMELAKAEYGLAHWDRLCVGEKMSNVLIDWTSWIDEAEEAEVRSPRNKSARSTNACFARTHSRPPTPTCNVPLSAVRRFATIRMGTMRAAWRRRWASTGAATSTARSRPRSRPQK